MRAAVRAICRPEVAHGLALAGLAPVAAESGAEAAAALALFARAPARGGVVLIEQSLYDALPGPLRRQVQRDGAPILMPFPGPRPTAAAGARPEDELLEILRRAIGYRVRLR